MKSDLFTRYRLLNNIMTDIFKKIPQIAISYSEEEVKEMERRKRILFKPTTLGAPPDNIPEELVTAHILEQFRKKDSSSINLAQSYEPTLISLIFQLQKEDGEDVCL